MSQGSDAADAVPESADEPRASTAAAVATNETATGRRRVGSGDMTGTSVSRAWAGWRDGQPVEQVAPFSVKFAGAGLPPFQEPLNPKLVLPPVASEPL